MPTTVLARAHRPPNFEAMVGQEHVVRALANALTTDRLHHAYLFTGTRGVGKTTVARILAKSLNCIGPDGSGGVTARPCGGCQACREIDGGRFIDYVELDAASNRGVEEITRLLDQSVYKPVMGRFKVYLIDEVHMLSTTAFNAMLKTLEEPPPYLKFILATTDPQKVPATVLSRCLQFNLRPMAPETIVAHLGDVLGREAVASERPALALLARAARGSMRDALSLADQAIAHGGGSVRTEAVRQMLGAVGREHAVALIDAVAAGDGGRVVDGVAALRDAGLSPAGALEEIAEVLQEVAVATHASAGSGAAEAADADDDPDAAAVARLAASLPADEVQLLYAIAIRGRADLALAPDEYGGLLMVLLRAVAFAPGGGASTSPPVAPSPSGSRAPLARPETAGARDDAAALPVTATGEPVAAAATVGRPVVAASMPAPAAATTRPGVASPTPAPVLPPAAGAPVPAEPPPPEAAAGPMPAPAAATTRPGVASPMPAPAAPLSTPVPMAAEPPPPEAAGPMLEGKAAADRWTALVRQMMDSGRIQAMVRELAWQADCVAVGREGVLEVFRLRVEREPLRADACREKLEAALTATLGHAVRIRLEAGAAADSPALRDAALREQRQQEAERTIREDPLVRALLSQYKTARIVPGSIKAH